MKELRAATHTIRSKKTYRTEFLLEADHFRELLLLLARLVTIELELLVIADRFDLLIDQLIDGRCRFLVIFFS